MFSRSTTNAAHSTSNSLALRNAEAEFGSLKRKLERREAQRRGDVNDNGIGPHLSHSSKDSAVAGVAATLSTTDLVTEPNASSEMLALASVFAATSRSPRQSVPLFSDGDASLEAVQTAHKKHNRAILVHNAQWDAARTRVSSMIVTNDAAHRDLERTIAAAQEAQNSDPPAIESSTCTSNYMGIRENIRLIAAAGNHIDGADVSPNDFEFLFSDATLTSREKVMLQRMRDLAAKHKILTANHAAVRDGAAQEKASLEGQLHDLRESQREALEEKELEWAEHRAALESDVTHWRDSAASLQVSLESARQLSERDRETAAAALASAIAQHKEDVAKWMQTVAAGDRELHKLRENANEMELRLSGSTQVLEQLREQLRTTSASLEAAVISRDALLLDRRHLTTQLESSRDDVKALRAAKPGVADAEVQVDTNSIISDLRDSLSSARTELSRLRLSNDNLLKVRATLEADLRSALSFKGMYEVSEEGLQRTCKELKAVSTQRHRDHSRRMQLVCENFCLRSLVVVLQRPNGFGERMENLQAENRWLMDKLQRHIPLRIQMQATSSNNLEVDISKHVGTRVLVQRHEGDEHDEAERDVVLHVADGCTQTWTGAEHSSTSATPTWKSVATSCSEQSIQQDLMRIASIRKAATLAQYVTSADTRHMVESSTGASRAIQMASQRFRRALTADNHVPSHDDDATGENEGDSSDDECAPLATKGSAAGAHEEVTRPPRPYSAQSASCSHASSGVPSLRSLAKVQPSQTTNEEAVLHETARGSSPQLCVFGVRDAPQNSALNGTPTQYFILKRSLGLVGAAGKQRELDLDLHCAMEKAVTIDEQLQQPRGVSSLPSTMPIRTLGVPRPTSASVVQHVGASEHSSLRPRSALVARSTSPMSSFMPIQRSALGSWKQKKEHR
jgi:hypothetical protein